MFLAGRPDRARRPARRPRPAARRLALLSAVALIAAAGAGASEPSPAGPQFQVNSYTTGYQGQARVALAAGGEFVVAWTGTGSAGNDDFYSSIHAQRFSGLGAAQGSEIQANQNIVGPQGSPGVALGDAGEFVVVWETYGSNYVPGNYREIEGQRFASDGTMLGGQFLVNTYETDFQTDPAVAAAANGDFVVVWESVGSSGGDTSYTSVQGQRFAAGGAALGGEFQIDSYTTAAQIRPAVARSPGGEFVVAWVSGGSAGTDQSLTSIQARRYSSAGAALGTDFQVNATTTGYQMAAAVAVDDDGGFVVVWESATSSGSDSSSSSILGQRFAADGNRRGGEFQVNSYTSGAQRYPRVASLHRGGGFVVVWQSQGSAGSDQDLRSIQARRFTAAGTPLSADFQVDSYTTGDQADATVAAAADGDFVVAWQSVGSGGSDQDGNSIQAQRYAVQIFSDGFESGNTGVWSSILPG